jgi:hypothetical protein
VILFYGEGRLGNQMFQYQALCGLARHNERLFAVGLEDLQGLLRLQGPRLSVVTRNRTLKRLVKFAFLPVLLRPLARTFRLCNYVSEERVGEPPATGPSGELAVRKGLCSRLTLVDGGHYQNASYWASLFPAPAFCLQAPLRAAALDYLAAACGSVHRAAFVHVRRGDYLTHADYGLKDFALPVDFYRAAIRELKARVADLHLVFVTDDPQWVKDNFRDIEHKSIASFDAALDFAIMTQCRRGVLSNSTFSLAAGLMMRDPELLIGPKHWFGFRANAWFPPQIRFEHPNLLYLAVEGVHAVAA